MYEQLNGEGDVAPLSEHEAAQQAKIAARAFKYLHDFGLDHVTEHIQQAGQLYAEYTAGSLTKERALFDFGTLNEEEFKHVWGMALDFAILAEYTKTHAEKDYAHAKRRAAQGIKLTKEQMREEVTELIKKASNINLETILIGASYSLAELDTYSPGSPESEAAISQAEFIYASLCEVIGIDGLASTLRSQVDILRLDNDGLSDFVEISRQCAKKYQDENGNYEAKVHLYIQNILSLLVGTCSHELVLATDPKHGVVIEEGEVLEAGPHQGARIIARLKSVGARANKLWRNYKETGEIKLNKDDIGITLISKDDDSLVQSYINLVEKMLAADHITPDPSPTRTQAFHIRGSDAFVNSIKHRLIQAFPDQQNLFEYVPDDTGFHVAKATGYYEPNDSTEGSDDTKIPFEIQLLTQEGRKDSRVGRAAHALFKLSRVFGRKYKPTRRQVKALRKLNDRKEHVGSDELCRPSEKRVEALYDDIAKSEDLRKPGLFRKMFKVAQRLELMKDTPDLPQD